MVLYIGRLNKCYSKSGDTYRAFGEQLNELQEIDAKYTYGGKELDSNTNFYYFNARYYDATIGRFINVDPIQDGSNWYVYCSNNPMSMVDPTGLLNTIYAEGREWRSMNAKQLEDLRSDFIVGSTKTSEGHITNAISTMPGAGFLASIFGSGRSQAKAEYAKIIETIDKWSRKYEKELEEGSYKVYFSNDFTVRDDDFENAYYESQPIENSNLTFYLADDLGNQIDFFEEGCFKVLSEAMYVFSERIDKTTTYVFKTPGDGNPLKDIPKLELKDAVKKEAEYEKK